MLRWFKRLRRKPEPKPTLEQEMLLDRVLRTPGQWQGISNRKETDDAF